MGPRPVKPSCIIHVVDEMAYPVCSLFLTFWPPLPLVCYPTHNQDRRVQREATDAVTSAAFGMARFDGRRSATATGRFDHERGTTWLKESLAKKRSKRSSPPNKSPTRSFTDR